MKTYKHFLQLLDGKFTKFDYGDETNMKLYGSFDPPEYNLNNVKVPTKIFVGEGDMISTINNAQKLSTALPNSMGYHVVDRPRWNHIDFTFSMDSRRLVFDYIIADLNTLKHKEVQNSAPKCL